MFFIITNQLSFCLTDQCLYDRNLDHNRSVNRIFISPFVFIIFNITLVYLLSGLLSMVLINMLHKSIDYNALNCLMSPSFILLMPFPAKNKSQNNYSNPTISDC
jgi:hypothetical protein